ncbi:hypothetical protein JVU11DRAFT_2245 [Chiua virens]|nr:hypothetical protein JVU11DRAFT_2245 [Chiua virens]
MPSTRIQSTNPMGPDKIVRCKHGEQAERQVSGTLKNPGREFYTCGRPPDKQCRFFYWVDDPIFMASPAVTRHVPPTGLCTPQASPATPAKRKRPEDFGTDGRATNIPRDSPACASESKTSQPADHRRLSLPSQHNLMNFHLRTASSRPKKSPHFPLFRKRAPEGGKEEYVSFLGLDPTQGSQSSVAPSTPKKPSSSLAITQRDRFGEPSSSALLTPPQSAEQHTKHVEAYSAPEPASPTRCNGKGKGRAIPQWDPPILDEDNPFVDGPSSFQAPSPVDSQRSSTTFTVGECIARNITDFQEAFERIRTCSNNFSRYEAPNYIATLEREKNALTLKNNAKKERIAELEAVITELKDKLWNLEKCNPPKILNSVCATCRAVSTGSQAGMAQNVP